MVCAIKKRKKGSTFFHLTLRLRSEPTDAAVVMSCVRLQRKDTLYHSIATERIARLRILSPPPPPLTSAIVTSAAA